MRGKPEPIPPEINEVSGKIVDAAYAVHSFLGPGLIESVCEKCLCHELSQRGFGFERQKVLPVDYKDVVLDDGLRLDLFVENKAIVELKAVEKLLPVHEAQLLTYLKLANCRLGLLIDFNVPVIKEDLVRVAF
jgi:GxxExxY protein